MPFFAGNNITLLLCVIIRACLCEILPLKLFALHTFTEIKVKVKVRWEGAVLSVQLVSQKKKRMKYIYRILHTKRCI